MPFYKEIWTFTTPNGGRWSEVWYCEAASMLHASSLTPGFVAHRMALAHPLTTWQKATIIELNSPLPAVIKPINQNGTNGVGVGPAPVSSAAVISLTSVAIPSKRRWSLRGWAAGMFYRDEVSGRDIVNPFIAGPLKDFIKNQQDNAYMIYPQYPVGTGGVVLRRLTRADGSAATGLTTLTTEGNHGLVEDDICTIQNTNKKQFPGLLGKFKVRAVPSVTTLKVQYTTPEDANLEMTTGTVKKYLPAEGAFISAINSGFSFLGSRQSKNDLTGSRGAKSATKIRNLV